MELLESQDPRKKKLVESSERHKRELEKNVKEIAGKTERNMKNALIIGGSLALGYLIVNQIASSKKKKHKVKKVHVPKVKVAEPEEEEEIESEDESNQIIPPMPHLISQIGAQVINQATALLLEMAREKLMEFIASRMKTSESSDKDN